MEFLSHRGIQFTHKNIAQDSEARDELTRRIGRTSVPVVVVGDEAVVGFDRRRLGDLLGLR